MINEVYIPQNSFSFTGVIVKGIVTLLNVLTEVCVCVCVLFSFPDGERTKKRWSSTRRQVCILQAQRESQL